MIRRSAGALLAVLVAFSAIGIGPVDAAPLGAIRWIVDHEAKTISAILKIQIYSGCSGDPSARAAACKRKSVTEDLAKKIKRESEAVWNKGWHYKCYRLLVIVDVKLASDRGDVDADRLGVRIDPSALGIRSWVDVTESYDKSKWRSDDPADIADPQNSNDATTWGEKTWHTTTYAHEIGHMLGLHDAYEDVKDPVTGKVTGSKKYADAPDDLMSTMRTTISQETIDRLILRNSQRLVDSLGNPVFLDDLVCEPEFLASFKGTQQEYLATNIMSTGSCSFAPTSSSTDQALRVDSSVTVGVRVVEAKGTELGYVLVPTFDPIVAASGLSGGRSSAAVGMFDMPVTIRVFRFNDRPAKDVVPEPRDLHADGCSTGGGGGGDTSDCGERSFPAWLAMSFPRRDDVWPQKSSLPILLKDLGYTSTRFDGLYRRCPGPEPWPGAFVDDVGGVIAWGKAPTFAAITQVADDWRLDKKDGRVEIEGSANYEAGVVGRFDRDVYEWTLTLCPLNADGQPPPSCP